MTEWMDGSDGWMFFFCYPLVVFVVRFYRMACLEIVEEEGTRLRRGSNFARLVRD